DARSAGEPVDEHFVPPVPPPLPRLDPVTKGAWLALFGGPLYLLIRPPSGPPSPGSPPSWRSPPWSAASSSSCSGWTTVGHPIPGPTTTAPWCECPAGA